MIDTRALSYVNMFALLGTLPKLCELVDEARELIADEEISIGFAVHNGPSATLTFSGGKCRIDEGMVSPVIKLPFMSPSAFNGMIDGTSTPIPIKGFTKIKFLLEKFTRLTDILTRYLRASEEDLQNEDFFNISTTLMLNVITNAVAQLGNEDPVSRHSASYISNGIIKVFISNGPSAAILAMDHKLAVIDDDTDEFMSYMFFADMKTARALFDGKLNPVAAIGTGDVRVGGMISQVDNVNRILDRVAEYLA